MTDLHSTLLTAIHWRMELARAATPGPWEPDSPMLSDVVNSALLGAVADCSVGTGYRAQSLDDAKHISANDPAVVIRHCEVDISRLERHAGDFPYDPENGPGDYSWTERCMRCNEDSPCIEVRELARAYGVEVSDG